MDNMDGTDKHDSKELVEQIDERTLIIYKTRDLTDEEISEVTARAAAFAQAHIESSAFSTEDSTENQSRVVEY